MSWKVSDYAVIYAIIDNTEHAFWGKITQIRNTPVQECLFELVDTTSPPLYFEALVPEWWVDSKELRKWTWNP